jgi:putative endonuclease
MTAADNLALGKIGEADAAEFLKKQGYRLVTANYRSSLGEIDIIARDKGTLCFVEVKSRLSEKNSPLEAIDKRKQRQLQKAALCFLKENSLLATKARFDVVAVRYSPAAKKEFVLIKDAFELGEDFSY